MKFQTNNRSQFTRFTQEGEKMPKQSENEQEKGTRLCINFRGAVK